MNPKIKSTDLITAQTRPMLSRDEHNADMTALKAAWDWLCTSRKTAPPNADIWDLRFHWSAYRDEFLQQLQLGTYRLSPMQIVGQKRQAMWGAKDALALKWVALRLQGRLPLHAQCEHIKGHGGGKLSVMRLSQTLQTEAYPWVCRTDIRGYYGAINKSRLLAQLQRHVIRPAYQALLVQYVHYSVEEGGEFYTPKTGIARGCALSPLMGALHLWAMDDYFSRQKKIQYVRYMDDFILLAKTRWALRQQVKALNSFFTAFGFEKHPDKTFIGRVSRGFDWMGAWLTQKGAVGIAPRALENHREKVRRLYERTRHWSKAKQAKRVSDYRHRWKIWGLSLNTSVISTVLAVVSPAWCLDVSIGDGWLNSSPVVALDFEQPYNASLSTIGNVGMYGGILVSEGGVWGESSDGQAHGLVVADDIIVAFNGTYTTNYLYSGYQGTVTYSYGQAPSVSTGVVSERNAGATSPYLFSAASGIFWRYGFVTSGNVQAKLYIGPKAPVGTHNIPNIKVYGASNIIATNIPLLTGPLLTGDGTSYVNIKPPPLYCSISAPPTINFGMINVIGASADKLLSSKMQGINITCSSDYADAVAKEMNISFTKTSGGGGWWRLDVSNTAGDVMAYIRARYVNEGGRCTGDSANELGFDGVNGKKTINNVGVGITNIPITWSLCSNGSGLLGVGTAQATVNINWD